MPGGAVMEKIKSEKNEIRLDVSLLLALDKGIEDFENGRTVPHEHAIEMVRQRLNEHVQNTGNSRGHR